MTTTNAYQLELFDFPIIERKSRRKALVKQEDRARDSAGRYATDVPKTEETEIERLKRELEEERRKNEGVASLLRSQSEIIIKQNNKLNEHGFKSI